MTDRPRIAYAVSSGEYSDCRVLCVCPTEADADAIVTRIRNEVDEDGERTWHFDAGVEEIVLLDRSVEPMSIIRIDTEVPDRGSPEERVIERVDWPWSHPDLWASPSLVFWRWVRAPVHQGRGGRLEVTASDKGRAIEVRDRLLYALRSVGGVCRVEEMKGEIRPGDDEVAVIVAAADDAGPPSERKRR